MCQPERQRSSTRQLGSFGLILVSKVVAGFGSLNQKERAPEMKGTITVFALLLGAANSMSTQTAQSYGLPELHKISRITLGPSYSCRPRKDFQKGYEHTALFLSSYAKQRNSPDLLFDGACRSDDFFEISTAGDDMSTIADLGKARLDALRTDQAFSLQRVNSPDLFSRFVRQMPVQLGHTYAVLINKRELRGLFYFTVTGYTPNRRLDLSYTVKEYQILSVTAESPGFDWNQKSQ